jgi:hypothetical protein
MLESRNGRTSFNWTSKSEIYYQDYKFFFSRYHITILRWRVLCFHYCSCSMMISEIVAELIFLCYLASELCAIEGVNEEM